VRNLALLGATVTLMLGAAAVAQITLQRLPPRAAIGAGAALLIGGLGSIVLALATGSAVCLVVSALLAGGGVGLAFMGGVALVNEVAPAERRGDVLSSCFAVGYVGLGLPVVGVGLGTGWIGLYASAVTFAVVIGCIGLALLVALRLTRDRGRGEASRRRARAA
jgi:MFS family permease